MPTTIFSMPYHHILIQSLILLQVIIYNQINCPDITTLKSESSGFLYMRSLSALYRVVSPAVCLVKTWSLWLGQPGTLHCTVKSRVIIKQNTQADIDNSYHWQSMFVSQYKAEYNGTVLSGLAWQGQKIDRREMCVGRGSSWCLWWQVSVGHSLSLSQKLSV